MDIGFEKGFCIGRWTAWVGLTAALQVGVGVMLHIDRYSALFRVALGPFRFEIIVLPQLTA